MMEVKFVEKRKKYDTIDTRQYTCCCCSKVIVKGAKFYDGEDFWHYDCYMEFVEKMRKIDRELCDYPRLLNVDLMDVNKIHGNEKMDW